MNLRVSEPHRNGNYEAPHLARGASSAAARQRTAPTTFPDEARLRGPYALVYALHRFQIGGTPIMRLVHGLLLVLAGLWATGALPGGRWGAIPFILLSVLLAVIGWRLRRADYVIFDEMPLPTVLSQRMVPDDKVAIHATGQFAVEGKYRRLTWLPGFYRTFATNEHALLCLARERHWLFFANWPADEPGMWYAFFSPQDIARIRWGELRFGSNRSPALAIDYRLTIPADGRRKQDKVRDETVYLAFATREDAEIVLADLLADQREDGRTDGTH